MYRNQVTVQDAIVAIQLIEISMLNSAILAISSALHSSFPTEPEESCNRLPLLSKKKLYFSVQFSFADGILAKSVLRKLGLNDMIDEQENGESGAPGQETPFSQLSAFSTERRRREEIRNSQPSKTPSQRSSAGESDAQSGHHDNLPTFSGRQQQSIITGNKEDGQEGEEEDIANYDLPDSEDFVTTDSEGYPVGKPVKRKRPSSAKAPPTISTIQANLNKKQRTSPSGKQDGEAAQADMENEAAENEENGELQQMEDPVGNQRYGDEDGIEAAAAEGDAALEFPFGEEVEDDGGMFMVGAEDKDEEEEQTTLLLAKKARKRFLD